MKSPRRDKTLDLDLDDDTILQEDDDGGTGHLVLTQILALKFLSFVHDGTKVSVVK